LRLINKFLEITEEKRLVKPPNVWGILSFREEGRPDKKDLQVENFSQLNLLSTCAGKDSATYLFV
jgi:hypothetical protein